jgi:hypothetical protein
MSRTQAQLALQAIIKVPNGDAGHGSPAIIAIILIIVITLIIASVSGKFRKRGKAQNELALKKHGNSSSSPLRARKVPGEAPSRRCIALNLRTIAVASALPRCK